MKSIFSLRKCNIISIKMIWTCREEMLNRTQKTMFFWNNYHEI